MSDVMVTLSLLGLHILVRNNVLHYMKVGVLRVTLVAYYPPNSISIFKVVGLEETSNPKFCTQKNNFSHTYVLTTIVIDNLKIGYEVSTMVTEYPTFTSFNSCNVFKTRFNTLQISNTLKIQVQLFSNNSSKEPASVI
jgi:hypothetical protein